MSGQNHWNTIYSKKLPEDLTWYCPHLERSLAYLEAAGLGLQAAIIDIGGGVSTFADDLLARDYSNLTVLDISDAALAAAKARLGGNASQLKWICADVTAVDLSAATYEFWHDRAVFHFLLSPSDRRCYLESVLKSLKSGGHLVVSTFGPNGPPKCSGLEVLHFSPESLHAEFGDEFKLIECAVEMHKTPWNTEQEFVHCHFQRDD